MNGFVDGLIENDKKEVPLKKHTQFRTAVLSHAPSIAEMAKMDTLFMTKNP